MKMMRMTRATHRAMRSGRRLIPRLEPNVISPEVGVPQVSQDQLRRRRLSDKPAARGRRAHARADLVPVLAS